MISTPNGLRPNAMFLISLSMIAASVGVDRRAAFAHADNTAVRKQFDEDLPGLQAIRLDAGDLELTPAQQTSEARRQGDRKPRRERYASTNAGTVGAAWMSSYTRNLVLGI